jgi:hypothetical protein
VDARLKKRILAFYFAGVINLVLGVYVLLAGVGTMESGTAMLIALFFLGFAAVDFYFPEIIKRKWREEQAKMGAQARQPDERP